MRPALLFLAIAIAIPASAAPVVRVSDSSLQNKGIGKSLAWALSLIPHSDSLTWTIIVEPHEEFQAAWRARTHSQNAYPQRCWTLTEKKETHCDADWVLEFSGMAKAGTLAHEYGHILCGTEEQDADWCGAQLMHGVPIAEIHKLQLPPPGF